MDDTARRSRAVAFFSAIALVAFAGARGAASSLAVSPAERSWEAQVGQEAYERYAQRNEIVPRQSPLYAVLDPVARRIASVADRDYYAPFRFILLDEAQPNAVAMPGGDVYVTTAMLSYLRNRDELAGVICHEVNHDIHHDMYDVYEAPQRGAQPLPYERAAELNADRSGAYTCAKAGFNPWGMVWNMRLHGAASQQLAPGADHPSDDQRLVALVALLRSDRAAFGRFRDDVADAAPLSNAPQFGQAAFRPAQYQPQYPQQYGQQYSTQYPQQYPPQYPQQYPSQYPQQSGPYPPPPLPACYPGC